MVLFILSNENWFFLRGLQLYVSPERKSGWRFTARFTYGCKGILIRIRACAYLCTGLQKCWVRHTMLLYTLEEYRSEVNLHCNSLNMPLAYRVLTYIWKHMGAESRGFGQNLEGARLKITMLFECHPQKRFVKFTFRSRIAFGLRVALYLEILHFEAS